MLENSLRSKRTRNHSFPDITWDHSHVVADDDDRVISYCIYVAPSVERVLEHASATGGHFVDHVLPLTDDVERAGAQPRAAGDSSPRYWDALHPFSAGGAYVNFLGEGEGADRVRTTYGDNYDRLARVKATYDPTNLFRVNQNIPPAAV